jgi:hypothetical protein
VGQFEVKARLLAGNAGAPARKSKPTLNAGEGARIPSIVEAWTHPKLKLTYHQGIAQA